MCNLLFKSSSSDEHKVVPRGTQLVLMKELVRILDSYRKESLYKLLLGIFETWPDALPIFEGSDAKVRNISHQLFDKHVDNIQ